jgi:hypothetical protein
MGKRVKWFLVLLLSAVPLRAQETRKAAPPPAVKHIWEAAFLENVRAGHFHISFQPVEADGQTIIRSRQTLELSVKRFKSMAKLRMVTGTDETEEGKVAGVFLQMEGATGPLVLTGKVKEKVLHVEVDQGRMTREIPWNDKVIGLRAQERLFQANKFKSGDKFTYQSFEPSLNTVVTVRATVHEEEEVELLGVKKKLFKAVLLPDKIVVPEAQVQLPPITVWMDKEGKVLRRQVEIDGLGKILLLRTTKEVALAQGDLSQLIDIGLKNLLFVNRKIGRFNETESAIYRITIAGDPMPKTALVQDERQEIKSVKDSTIELHVKAIRVPPAEGDDKPMEEFLKSCHYLNSDHQRVQALTRQAIGEETDSWGKARRIESWVHRYMQIDATVPVAPAGQIAEKLRGDCRQYAMLTAAMCRAAGVPSRTAIGLVYGEDRSGRPMFGFHMWTEVWVRGRWLGLDATLGIGSVGAAHIKVTDHSWHNVQSLTPLLPLQRVLGKMRIEVVRVEH